MVSWFQKRVAQLEDRLAGIGLYTFKHLKDILHDGGNVTLNPDDSASKKKSIQKLVDIGLLEEDLSEPNHTLYKLSEKGRVEAHKILADPKLRNPKNLNSPNNWR